MMGLPNLYASLMAGDKGAGAGSEPPVNIDPLIASTMLGHAQMQSQAVEKNATEQAADANVNQKPLKITTTVDPNTGEAYHDIKNFRSKGGPDINKIMEAANQPFKDVASTLEEKERSAIQRVIEQFSSGASGDPRNFIEKFGDAMKVKLGIETPQEVALKRMSQPERELFAIEKAMPVIQSLAQERRAEHSERTLKNTELNQFLGRVTNGEFSDPNKAIATFQQEQGALRPGEADEINGAFQNFGRKQFKTRQETIASVKPEETATYQNAADYITDKEDPNNPFSYGEKARLSSRFAAAKQTWDNLTQKQKQDRQLEADRIAVQRAQVAAAEHSNRIQEAALRAGQLSQSGDTAIASLPKDVQNTVRGIAEGRLDISKVTSMRGGGREAMASLVSAYDPTWSTATAPARAATFKDFTSGPTANKITAINTAIHHLDTLAEAGKQLQNASPQLWNRIKNVGLNAVGDARVVKFTQAANAISAELAKSYGGGEATDSARKEWGSNFSAVQSPEQIQAAVQMAVKLLGGASSSIKDRYERGMGKDSAALHVLSDDSRRVLQKNGINPDIIETSGNASPAAPTGKVVTDPNQILSIFGKGKKP